VPPWHEGTIIDVKIFSRRIDDPLLEKEHGAKIGQLRSMEREEILRISEARDEELKLLLQRPDASRSCSSAAPSSRSSTRARSSRSRDREINLSEGRPHDAQGAEQGRQRADPSDHRRGA
jgi:hypothetical protein